jgi:cytochrome c biogenesis protein CcdA
VTQAKRNLFPCWLILFILTLLLQAASFLTGLYFLAENLRDGNRWIAFISIVVLNIVFLFAISLINRKMSVGVLGSSMQKLRTTRFSAAFLTVAFGSLLSPLGGPLYR